MRNLAVIRRNGEEFTLTTFNEETKFSTVFELDLLNSNQLTAVREHIVNWWAKENSFPPLYPE